MSGVAPGQGPDDGACGPAPGAPGDVPLRGASGDAPLPPAHHMDPVERMAHRVLQAGIAVSVALLAAGLLLGAARGEGLATRVVPFAGLPTALASLDPAAFLSLGLIVLIATPFARVTGSIVAFARQHDRRYVVVTSVVLAVMLVSVLVGRA